MIHVDRDFFIFIKNCSRKTLLALISYDHVIRSPTNRLTHNLVQARLHAYECEGKVRHFLYNQTLGQIRSK